LDSLLLTQDPLLVFGGLSMATRSLLSECTHVRDSPC